MNFQMSIYWFEWHYRLRTELESQLKSLEVPRELRPIDSGDMAKIRELEKLVRTLRLEKDEVIKDKLDSMERLKLQEKELKDALAQRKLGKYF